MPWAVSEIKDGVAEGEAISFATSVGGVRGEDSTRARCPELCMEGIAVLVRSFGLVPSCFVCAWPVVNK